MGIQDPKPIFNQNNTPSAVNAHATSVEKNPFLSFYHHIGQYLENHYKWAFVKANQTISVLKEDIPDASVLSALEDVLAAGGILAAKAAEGAAIYGQNVTTNPAAHQALEDFMVAFQKFATVSAEAERGPGAPPPLPPPTKTELVVEPTEDGSSSAKYAEGADWTTTGDGTSYPSGAEGTLIGGFSPKVPKPADEPAPTSTEPTSSN